MKTEDLITIGGAALVTMTLTVAAFLPNSLDAGGDAFAPQVAQPRLVSNGAEITLVPLDNRAFKPGEEPVFELKACNTNIQPVEVAVRVSMTSISLNDRMSRMGPVPVNLWQHFYLLTLKPNETKSISIATRTKLPEKSTINVMLQPATASEATAEAPGPDTPSRLGRFDPKAIVALRYSTLTSTAGTPAGSVDEIALR